MDCLAKKCGNKSIGIHFMYQCVLSTACGSTVCRSTFSSTIGGSFSTDVRKKAGKDTRLCIPVVLHRAAVPSQARRTPGALMPAGQGGGTCQHQHSPRGALFEDGMRPLLQPAFANTPAGSLHHPEVPQGFRGSKGCKKTHYLVSGHGLHLHSKQGKFRICIPFAPFNTVCEFTEWTLNSDVAGKDCLLNWNFSFVDSFWSVLPGIKHLKVPAFQ